MDCSNLNQPAGNAWCQLYCFKTAQSMRVPLQSCDGRRETLAILQEFLECQKRSSLKQS
jgi:hypothetical protein